MTLPRNFRATLNKYAFNVKTPAGGKPPAAPAPAAAPPPVPKGLTEQAQDFWASPAAKGATPKPAKLLEPAGPSIGAGPKPVGNNVIFANQNAATPPPPPAARPAAGGRSSGAALPAQMRQPAPAAPAPQQAPAVTSSGPRRGPGYRPTQETTAPTEATATAGATGRSSGAALPSHLRNTSPRSAPPPQAAPRVPGIYREGETPASHTGLGSYVDVLDRWYNPWTTQQVTEKGETGLMRAGQTAMGIGAGAAATAAAIPAAAAVLPAGAQSIAGLGTGAAGGAVGANLNTLGVAGTAAMASSAATGAMPQQQPPEQQPAATTTTPGQPAQQTQQVSPDELERRMTATDTNAAKPAAPMTPEQKQQANTDVMAKLNSDMPDAEKKQLAQQHVQQMLDSNPEMKQGMADLHAGKDTPQAKAFQAEVDKAGNAYIREEFAKLRQQNPGAGPQEQGGMLNSVMQGWQNMPEPMKWMMGIGLGGGLLGVLGSMFGGGGGMGMLGLLGLGAAGLAGAAGGMFGSGAQDALGGMVGQLGQATGMIPKDMDLSALKGEDAVQRATADASGGGIWGGIKAYFNPEGEAKKVQGKLDQANQLERLMMVPEGMRPGLMRQISPNSSPEEIQQMLNNAKQMHGAMNDPKHQLGQQMQKGRAFVSDPTKYVNDAASEYYNPAKWDVMPWNWGGKTSADRGALLAKHWAKEARCWKGYEPVPGKAPYSENSCRPIGSKKKKKKTEKAEKRAEEIIDEWLKKYRARGQKGRWVNTRRGSKTELKMAH